MSFVPLEHQAAGHPGAIRSGDGSLFAKPALKQEIDFYTATQERMSKLSDDLALGETISDWMPRFIGTLTPGITQELSTHQSESIDDKTRQDADKMVKLMGTDEYILLDNELYGFNEPSVLDIKLGSILYDDTADDGKVARMKKVSNTTTSGSLGFRVCGMKIPDSFGKLPEDPGDCDMANVCHYDPAGYISFDKFFGRRLTDVTVEKGLEIFFRYNELPKQLQDQLIEKFSVRLQMLYNCMLDTEMRMVSGSLLFVFENDLARWKQCDYEDPLIKEMTTSEDSDGSEDNDSDNADPSAPLSRLSLIDFAHTQYTPGKGYDEEVVNGIEKLLDVIQRI